MTRWRPILAFMGALFLGALVMAVTGQNPMSAYAALFTGAFGDTNAWARTLAKRMPCLMLSRS